MSVCVCVCLCLCVGGGFELSFVWEGGGCDKNGEFVWVVCNLEGRS